MVINAQDKKRVGRFVPALVWAPAYERSDLRGDIVAGLTVGALLVPQGMAYALLAGLPPEIGLYAATIPVLIYALFGTSRQLAVGPVAIVSLLTASSLASIVEEGTASYLEAAALLAIMVGIAHMVLGLGRLGFVVNFLSHSVLVGFTAAAAVIIAVSQAKYVLGISVPRSSHFHESVRDLVANVGDTHGPTLAVGLSSLALLIAVKRWARRVPGPLVLVIVSTLAVKVFGLVDHGVSTVGVIPDSLPHFAVPVLGGGLETGVIGDLIPTAIVVTLVGFLESTAVAKVYARRHHYEVVANQELVSLGAANVAAGLFGGYPVSGGFGRTAVNDSAGARTPLASVISAGIILLTLAFLTPLFTDLPNAALGALIIMAVAGLVDVAEMKHIAKVKRTDLISLATAFFATLVLGIEIGILVAVAASVLVVFARMSVPHTAVLGHVQGTTSYRNVARFPEVECCPGVEILRIDAALSFVNAVSIKQLLLEHAAALAAGPAHVPSNGGSGTRVLVLDCSGINDLDATGADMLGEVVRIFDGLKVELHLSDVKGPVRDVLKRAGIWDRLGGRIHTSTHDAVQAISVCRPGPVDQRRAGIDSTAGTDRPVEVALASVPSPLQESA